MAKETGLSNTSIWRCCATPADTSSPFRHRRLTGTATGRGNTAATRVIKFPYRSDLAPKRCVLFACQGSGGRYPAAPSRPRALEKELRRTCLSHARQSLPRHLVRPSEKHAAKRSTSPIARFVAPSSAASRQSPAGGRREPGPRPRRRQQEARQHRRSEAEHHLVRVPRAAREIRRPQQQLPWCKVPHRHPHRRKRPCQQVERPKAYGEKGELAPWPARTIHRANSGRAALAGQFGQPSRLPRQAVTTNDSMHACKAAARGAFTIGCTC